MRTLVRKFQKIHIKTLMIKFHEDVNYMNRNTVLSIYNPLTPKIFSVILLTVHYKILLMLLLRIWYWINY